MRVQSIAAAHQAHKLPLPQEQNQLILGVVWVWRGPGRREEAGLAEAVVSRDTQPRGNILGKKEMQAEPASIC